MLTVTINGVLTQKIVRRFHGIWVSHQVSTAPCSTSEEIHLHSLSNWRWEPVFYIIHIWGSFIDLVRDKQRIAASFEDSVVFQVLVKLYLHDHFREARRVLTAKHIFHPKHLMKHAPDAKLFKIMQREDQIAIIAPQVYQKGFKMGYNVAKATNFADF